MLEDVRKYMRAGFEAIAAQRPDEILGRVQGFADQLTALAAGFVEWSAEARDSLLREVKDLVTRQIQEIGVATQLDLDVLRARIDRLEREAGRTHPGGGGDKGSSGGRKGHTGGGSASPASGASRGRSKAATTSNRSMAPKR
ncbi:MAG TPA: hypothetical protein VEM93_04070, partial [Actinomycetota bacterium]|nr:hypothetical protein [Actinomycetota bacterium]